MRDYEGSRAQPALELFDQVAPADAVYDPRHIRGMVMGTPPWNIRDTMLARSPRAKTNQKTGERYVNIPIHEGHAPFRTFKRWIRVTPRSTGPHNWMHPGYGGIGPPAPPAPSMQQVLESGSLAEFLARSPNLRDRSLAGQFAEQQQSRQAQQRLMERAVAREKAAARVQPPPPMTAVLEQMAKFGDKTALGVLQAQRVRQQNARDIEKRFAEAFKRELRRK